VCQDNKTIDDKRNGFLKKKKKNIDPICSCSTRNRSFLANDEQVVKWQEVVLSNTLEVVIAVVIVSPKQYYIMYTVVRV